MQVNTGGYRMRSKLIITAVALLIGMVSMGQSVKTQKSALTQTLDISKEQSYFGKLTDVITQADTLRNYTIGIDKSPNALKQYARIKLTENSGTAVVNVKVQGKVFWDEAYTDLLDVTYAGTGSDTTIVFDGTTAHEMQFFNILLDGDGSGTFNVTAKSEIKFYK